MKYPPPPQHTLARLIIIYHTWEPGDYPTRDHQRPYIIETMHSYTLPM